MITRRRLLFALGTGTFAAVLPSFAQQARVRRVGMISSTNADVYAPWLAAFRGGMADLRWVEGRDYVIDVRYGNGDRNALPRLTAELAAWQPEVVVMASESSIPALTRKMKSVPIVLAGGVDPVGLGFAASLQRPGGNITGLTNLSTELGRKRLELLYETFPRISHFAVLSAADSPSNQVKSIEEAAAQLKLRLSLIGLRQAADIEPAFKRGAALGVQGYVVAGGALLVTNRRALVGGAARARVPATFVQSEFVEAGGLMSYSASAQDNFRRAAAYVDKILKGARPGDLPIEQPTKFELVVNLKTAKTLGFNVPQSILLRADRVIE